jgi:hypothetical protein
MSIGGSMFSGASDKFKEALRALAKIRNKDPEDHVVIYLCNAFESLAVALGEDSRITHGRLSSIERQLARLETLLLERKKPS